MYLGIDIGGTKTLVAVFDNRGQLVASQKFPTPAVYTVFLKELAITVANLSTEKFLAAGLAVPGKVDRKQGLAVAFGNLSWINVPIKHDVQRMFGCPVFVENDANLAGLSEAMLLKQYSSILYVTISTGIGTGVITNQRIDPDFEDSEGGQILVEHRGQPRIWEDFAAGSAIVKRFGKRASEITDQKTWKIIAHDFAIGLYDLIAMIQPDAVVLGGSIPTYFDRFDDFLIAELKRYETPLIPIPPLLRAQRPQEAVVYGCYHLAKSEYGKINT